MSSVSADDEFTSVIAESTGHAGIITLNRPEAINALTHDMVIAIDQALRRWEHDQSIRTVVIVGAGERGLCAGGDVVAIYRDAQAGGAATRTFWADEYRLNAFISAYPKPIVAVMDGVVMGGGVGISAHASCRVVTDTSRIAMPEVGIGFVPDVGGTYLLSRAPGQTGVLAGLTGRPFSGAGAIALGFADQMVAHAHIPRLLTALETHTAEHAIAEHSEPTAASPFLARAREIERCLALDSVAAILASLERSNLAVAADTAQSIRSKSPTAVCVTHEAIRRSRHADLKSALSQEYRVSVAALQTADLVEGIRAQLIDKDRQPKWSPATVEDVTEADVQNYFLPLSPSDELTWSH